MAGRRGIMPGEEAGMANGGGFSYQACGALLRAAARRKESTKTSPTGHGIIFGGGARNHHLAWQYARPSCPCRDAAAAGNNMAAARAFQRAGSATPAALLYVFHLKGNGDRVPRR